jgi:hypothetical protein
MYNEALGGVQTVRTIRWTAQFVSQIKKGLKKIDGARLRIWRNIKWTAM